MIYRCIDFVFYYPRQLIPYGGTCGLGICGGTVDFLKELEDDSDFNRTFGSVADICVEELIDEVSHSPVLRCWSHS